MDRLLRVVRHPLLRVLFPGNSGILWPIAAASSMLGCILVVWQLVKGRGQHPGQRSHTSNASPATPALVADATSHSNPKRAMASRCNGLVDGAQLVTICAAGVLLRETTPGQVEESATLRRQVVEPLRRLLQKGSRVVIIAHTESEVGEAALRAALEEDGLLGQSPTQLPPHRLLVCSTAGGKASMVRQLEPDVHVEFDAQAASEVVKFARRVVVANPAAAASQSAADSSLLLISSLEDILG